MRKYQQKRSFSFNLTYDKYSLTPFSKRSDTKTRHKRKLTLNPKHVCAIAYHKYIDQTSINK